MDDSRGKHDSDEEQTYITSKVYHTCNSWGLPIPRLAMRDCSRVQRLPSHPTGGTGHLRALRNETVQEFWRQSPSTQLRLVPSWPSGSTAGSNCLPYRISDYSLLSGPPARRVTSVTFLEQPRACSVRLGSTRAPSSTNSLPGMTRGYLTWFEYVQGL